MINRILLRNVSFFGLLIALVGCRQPQQPDEVAGGPLITTDVAAGGTAVSEGAPDATEIPAPTAMPLPVPPNGWVELPSAALGVALYHPASWEVIPFDDHKLDLRAPEGDGWIEINKVDASNAQDWGAGDLTWNPQAILTTLVVAAREDGEFADPIPATTISGRDAWTTQGTNDVIGDRLWIGVTGLSDQGVVALGHGQETTGNWDSELVPTYRDILLSIHTVP